MDVIKGLGERPGVFSVVDLKLAVWRYPGRLDGREVGASNHTCKLLFGELDCPDSGSGSYVKNIQAISWNGRKVEGAV